MDSSGNLYGTTSFGGAYGNGTVFELARGSGKITTLASHRGTQRGDYLTGGVIMDSSGNLYGTSSTETVGGSATVFELAHGSNTITTLASFNYTEGPRAGLIMDSSGNLYGTTNDGGAFGDGAVFELGHGSHTIATLASFNGTNGAGPWGCLVMDSSGNLFGTTQLGGAFYDPSAGNFGSGTVFVLAHGSSTITTLASFIGNPDGSVTMDSSGNLYGTTNSGGAYGVGSVFELAHGSKTITTLASFKGTNGELPYTNLIMDSSGNLFGTTNGGGASYDPSAGNNGSGTVFELALGSGTITTLASFNGTNGEFPSSGLVMDSSGNLYGTASGGGASNDGTIFELPGAVSRPSRATTLAFEQQPANTYVGVDMPTVTVAIKDQDGNILTSDNSDKITLTLGSQSPKGTLYGVITKTVTDGEATFPYLSIYPAGNGYTLVASTNAGGVNSTTSKSFNITIAPIAPTVTTNPTNQTVVGTQTATFTAAANGSPTPRVIWQVSRDGGKTFADLYGTTIDTLTVLNVTTAMNGYKYRAVFSNGGGTVNSTVATLTVLPTIAPVITVNPTSQTLAAGQTATFTASASGRPAPTVYWEFSPDGGKTWLYDGVTGTTLVLNNVTAAMNGYKFRAVISNGVGRPVVTSAAALTVKATTPPPPGPIWHNNVLKDVEQFDHYAQLLLQAELNADAFFYFYFSYTHPDDNTSVTQLAIEWSGNVAEIYQAAVNYVIAYLFVIEDAFELARGSL